MLDVQLSRLTLAKVSYLISVIVAVVFRDKQTLVWEFQWNLRKPLPYASVEVNQIYIDIYRCRYANRRHQSDKKELKLKTRDAKNWRLSQQNTYWNSLGNQFLFKYKRHCFVFCSSGFSMTNIIFERLIKRQALMKNTIPLHYRRLSFLCVWRLGHTGT